MIKNFEKRMKLLKNDIYETEDSCEDKTTAKTDENNLNNLKSYKSNRSHLKSIGNLNNNKSSENKSQVKKYHNSPVNKERNEINKKLKKIEQLFEINGELMFLVKWNDSTKQYISSKFMNKHYPLDIIKFYESNILFEKNIK